MPKLPGHENGPKTWAERGENSGSATKNAKNVDEEGENGVSATKNAKNVAGEGEIGGPATKMAKNVDENDARSMLGMTIRRFGHKNGSSSIYVHVFSGVEGDFY